MFRHRSVAIVAIACIEITVSAMRMKQFQVIPSTMTSEMALSDGVMMHPFLASWHDVGSGHGSCSATFAVLEDGTAKITVNNHWAYGSPGESEAGDRRGSAHQVFEGTVTQSDGKRFTATFTHLRVEGDGNSQGLTCDKKIQKTVTAEVQGENLPLLIVNTDLKYNHNARGKSEDLFNAGSEGYYGGDAKKFTFNYKSRPLQEE